MNKFLKNFLLLIAVFILSYLTAPYFGSFYDKFSLQYNNSFLGTGKDLSLFIAGLPVAYVFFVPFLYEIFGSGSKIKWILWLLLPPTLFWLSADRYYIYIPIILAIVAFFLAKLINFIISKLKK